MATQVPIQAETRDDDAKGKGPAKRLRASGRVPAVVYGGDLEATAVSVDALDLYHALRTEAGMNVLIRLAVDGDEHLSIVRDVQRHPLRGDVLHCDFQAVRRDQVIPAEIPLHVENEDDPRQRGGVVNTILYTIPILVTPLEVPSSFTLDLLGMDIGDVLRIEDLADQLPAAAEFDIEPERVVVTINAPTELTEEEEETEAEEALEEFAGEGELEEGEEEAVEGDEEPTEDDEA